jgi:hypothetical protein
MRETGKVEKGQIRVMSERLRREARRFEERSTRQATPRQSRESSRLRQLTEKVLDRSPGSRQTEFLREAQSTDQR